MKETKDFKTIIMEKKATLDILDTLMSSLSYEEERVLFEYDKVGEEQRTDDDGNLLYIDKDGNKTTEVTDTPAMRNVYGDVKKEKLDERDTAKLSAINKIRDTLASLA